MTSKTPLPATIRETFERYGIIKPPTVLPLDKLLEAAAEREMKVELNAGPTVSQAVITTPTEGCEFTQVADSPELAVAAALAMALKATIPFQATLFSGDEADEEDEPEAPLFVQIAAQSEVEAEFPHVDDLEGEHAGKAIERDLRAAGHNVEWDDEPGVIVDLDTGLIWSDEFLESELDKIRATAGAR